MTEAALPSRLEPAGPVLTMQSLPPSVALACSGTNYFGVTRRSDDSLMHIVEQKATDAIMPAVRGARASLEPVDRKWLGNRLSLLWSHMSHERDEDRATAWLHETARLLSDLPQDIVSWAIDRAIIESERGFMPSVGAIRKHADPKASEREAGFYRIEAVARELARIQLMPEDGRPFPVPGGPHDAVALLDELGARPPRRRFDRWDPAPDVDMPLYA